MRLWVTFGNPRLSVTFRNPVARDYGIEDYDGAYSVTPSDENQVLATEGKRMTGDVTVQGDANLQPENILSGVSIFGVSGAITLPTITQSGTILSIS